MGAPGRESGFWVILTMGKFRRACWEICCKFILTFISKPTFPKKTPWHGEALWKKGGLLIKKNKMVNSWAQGRRLQLSQLLEMSKPKSHWCQWCTYPWQAIAKCCTYALIHLVFLTTPFTLPISIDEEMKHRRVIQHEKAVKWYWWNLNIEGLYPDPASSLFLDSP